MTGSLRPSARTCQWHPRGSLCPRAHSSSHIRNMRRKRSALWCVWPSSETARSCCEWEPSLPMRKEGRGKVQWVTQPGRPLARVLCIEVIRRPRTWCPDAGLVSPLNGEEDRTKASLPCHTASFLLVQGEDPVSMMFRRTLSNYSLPLKVKNHQPRQKHPQVWC